MKINGLTIFSLILGTYSLSLNQSKKQTDLTEDATLPSADIAKRYAGAYPDSDDFTVFSTEANIKTPYAVENRKEHILSHPKQEAVHSSFFEVDSQQNYNSGDDFSTITTVRPQPPPSYFARFITRRNTEKEYNSEVDNEKSDPKHTFYQYWSDAYCTERIQEKIDDDESNKVNDSESESFTEKSINDTEVESSGQVLDYDSPIRFHLDLENMLINKTKSKRESPLYQNAIEEQTPLSKLDVDYSNQRLDEYVYDQSFEDVEDPNYSVRLLYGLSYLYSVIRGGTSNVTKMVTKFFN